MSRRFLRVTVLIVCLLTTLAVPAGPTRARGSTPIRGQLDPPPSFPISSGYTIAITNLGFDPALLTVTVGDQVTWVNNTGQTHVLVSGEPVRTYLPLVLRTTGGSVVSTPPFDPMTLPLPEPSRIGQGSGKPAAAFGVQPPFFRAVIPPWSRSPRGRASTAWPTTRPAATWQAMPTRSATPPPTDAMPWAGSSP
jgi:hypothetical protein